MDINKISLPDVYLDESYDFRFFVKWLSNCLAKEINDTDNFIDLYDSLRCPKDLLWLLGDTIGYKFDDRLPHAFNRLVILYFMSMIRLKGSKDGITLGAEINLAQFNILKYGKEKDILYDRLEDTSIPVNSVYVTPHVKEGYIDVVYFADKLPIDTCLEYVRPLGMYLFQNAGVRYDSKTKVSVDARLTNSEDLKMSIGSTHIGHYSRNDYASLQRTINNELDTSHERSPVYYRNSTFEENPDDDINPGYRAMYSLQLCNNEHISESLLGPIFSIGYGPDDVSVMYPDDYIIPPYVDRPINGKRTSPEMAWNLRLDRDKEEQVTSDVYTVDKESDNILNPKPAVNPPMFKLGDSISLNDDNSKYYMTETGVTDSEDI